MGVIMKKWEFKTVVLDKDTYITPNEDATSTIAIPINKLGEQGWELVNIIRDEENNNFLGYFKRELDSGNYAAKSGAKLNLQTDIKIKPESYLK